MSTEVRPWIADRCKQSLEMKLGQKGVALARPTDEPACRKQIHGIPDAVIADQAEECGGNDHRDTPDDAAFDTRREAEGFDRQQLAMIGVNRKLFAGGACARYRDDLGLDREPRCDRS